MSYEFRSGNLLDSGADALVNTVNCVGVMGKGLALQFKQRYPEMFLKYQMQCRAGFYQPGDVHTFLVASGVLVFNAATKDHWKDASRIRWIQSIVDQLAETSGNLLLTTIAIPPLGCGLGGLKWDEVRPLLVAAFEHHPVHALIYGREA